MFSHAARDTATDVGVALSHGVGEATRALAEFGRAIGLACTTSLRFMKNTTRAHYNLAGQYTAPIEQEFYGNDDTNIPKPSDLNFIGQTVLTVPVPLTLLSIFASISVMPLAINSFQSLLRSYVNATNLALIDLPYYQLQHADLPGVAGEKDNRNLIRQIYGFPGFVLGGASGLVTAAVLGLGRSVLESRRTGSRALWSVLNLSVYPIKFSPGLEDENDKRHPFLKYGLGGAGLVGGLLLGTLALPAFIVGRIIAESCWTGMRAFFTAANPSWYPGQLGVGLGDKEDQRNGFCKYVLGAPGVVLGFAIGAVTSLVISVARIAADSWRTAKRAFFTIVNFAWHPEKIASGLESDKDDRHPFRKYGLGAPGLIAGLVVGAAILPLISFGRIIADSWRSAKRAFFTMTNIASYPNNIAPGIDDKNDTRHSFRKYGLGLPGLIGGLALGIAVSPFIFFGRVIADSWRTSKRAFFTVANLGWHPIKIAPGLESDKDDRHPLRKYGLGVGGLLAGLLAGTAVLPVIAAGRIIADSWRTTKRAFFTVANLAWYPDKIQPGLEDTQDVRHPFRQYGLGAPGLVIGLLAGCVAALSISIARIVADSWRTSKRAFFTMINFAWYPDKVKPGLEDENDKRHPFRKYGLGGIGLVAGSLAGAATVPFVIAARILADSWRTAKRAFFSVVNLTWYPDEIAPGFNDKNDTRHPFRKYGLGAPGALAGLLAGAVVSPFLIIGRIIADSVRTTEPAFFTVANLAWYPEKLAPGLENKKDKRHPFRKYGLGLFGLITGLTLGTATLPLLIMGRIAADSARTAERAFYSVLNLAAYPLEIAPGLESDKDNRHPFRKYGLGAPGLVAGLVAGTVVAPFIILARIINGSWLTGKRAFFTAANVAWTPDKIQPGLEDENDKRHGFSKYGFGAIGLGIGFVLGIAAIPLIAAGRVLADSLRTGKRAFFTIANRIWYPKDISPGLSDKTDDRHPFRKYGLGAPGLIGGLLTGLAAAPFLILGRVIADSWRTSKRCFFTVTNLGNYPDKLAPGLEDANDVRHPFRKYGLGAPGIIPGLLLGTAAAMFIAVGRVFADSVRTGKRAFNTMSNLAFYPDVVGPGLNDANDTRHPFRKYGLGAPGLILGLIAGTIKLPFVATYRIVKDSYKTAKSAFFTMANLVWHPTKLAPGLEDANDTRHPFRKYGLGWPGLMLGLGLGVAAMPFLLLGRIAADSFRTAKRAFFTVVNLSHYPRQFAPGLEDSNDTRHAFRKYGLGGAGLPVGLALGAVAAVGVLAARVANQTRLSWQALSGSLLNGAIEQPCFDGLGGDERHPVEKAMGALGYITALATTLPVAALTWTARKIPLATAAVLGVTLSPLVAVGKALAKAVEVCKGTQRFHGKAKDETDEMEQSFRNLFSSLTVWGRFTKQFDVAENQDGEQKTGTFIRKSVTFNANTIAEKLLKMLHDTYRNSLSLDRNELQERLESVKDELKETYANNCFSTANEIHRTHEEIEEMYQYIRHYLFERQEKEKPVPSVYSSQSSWRATFWGGKDKEKMGEKEEEKQVFTDVPSTSSPSFG